MEDQRHDRLLVLMQQERNADALKLINELLFDNPQDALALINRATIESNIGEYEQALETIDQVIGIVPDWNHPFTLKARLLILVKNYSLAEVFLKQSLELDPNDAVTWNVYAFLRNAEFQFQDALEKIDRSLELDPSDTDSLNLRSMILMKLKKKSEAFETIQGSLNENPNDEFTHATYGWNLLEAGDHKKSLDHFREALRINPNYENAQNGMAEALKARYLVYRWFLLYSFWLAKQTKQTRIIFIVGFVVVMRVLRKLATTNEELQPVVIPVLVIGVLFAFSTWIINPLSNLFLRMNPYGKHLLDKKEMLSSSFVGISLSLCALGVIAYFITFNDSALAVAIFGLTMMIPTSTMFADPKNKLVYYSGAMAITGCIAVILSYTENNIFNGATVVYILLFGVFQFVANYFVLREE